MRSILKDKRIVMKMAQLSLQNLQKKRKKISAFTNSNFDY